MDPTLEEDPNAHWKFGIKTALIYDAVYIFANALKHLDHMAKTKHLDCNGTSNWEHGLSLITYMRTVRTLINRLATRKIFFPTGTIARIIR